MLTIYKRILLLSSVLFFAAGSTSLAQSDAPNIRQLYVSALRAMSDLSQPPYLTYRLESTSQGLEIDLQTIRGQVWLNIHPGSTSDRWNLAHQTDEYQSEIINAENAHRYLSQRSFFDPTWYGAYRALREGMLGSQDPAPARTPQPNTTPAPADSFKTIGVVSALGPGIYALEDRGAARCSNGDPGHAIHLRSRERNWKHQLTDIVVDLQSTRFCMVRFGFSDGFGFAGIVEQHYSDVGGYWLQTDGFLDGNLRVFGIATHHGIWRYRLFDVLFPPSLPSETFAP